MFFENTKQPKPTFLEIIGAVFLGICTTLNPLCYKKYKHEKSLSNYYIIQQQNTLTRQKRMSPLERPTDCCNTHYYRLLDKYILKGKYILNKEDE